MINILSKTLSSLHQWWLHGILCWLAEREPPSHVWCLWCARLSVGSGNPDQSQGCHVLSTTTQKREQEKEVAGNLTSVLHCEVGVLSCEETCVGFLLKLLNESIGLSFAWFHLFIAIVTVDKNKYHSHNEL